MTNIASHTIRGFAKTGPNPLTLSFLRRVLQLRQQRIALRNLDANRLADLGISPKEAAVEAAKPMWNVPCHWQN